MTSTPRRAFEPRSSASMPEHPLSPDRKPERSRLADPPLVSFGTRIPADLTKAIKLAAVQRGMTIQEVVETALRTWLAS